MHPKIILILCAAVHQVLAIKYPIKPDDWGLTTVRHFQYKIKDLILNY